MKTILVVDDSMMTRMMLTTIIKEHYPEWTIVQAKDADDALEKVIGVDFDFATIDMNMPGRTGLELIPLLQKSHPRAKMALLTANIQKKVSDNAKEIGVELLSKPVNETIILKFLEQ